MGKSYSDWCFSEMLVAVKFSSLLILIGLALDPMSARAQLDGGNPYDNYTDFEACQGFLDGVRTSRRNAGTLTSVSAWTVGLS